MKEWSAPTSGFPYNFNEVCFAFFNRYPNSFAKHIHSEDVLERKITEDKIFTKKLIVKQGSSILKHVPRWLSRMTDIRIVPVIEESIYDKTTRTLTTYTRNVSHMELFHLHEKVHYRDSEHLDGPLTEVNRAVSLAFNSGKMSSLYEKITLLGFKKSINNTMKGFTEVLELYFGSRHPLHENMGSRLKQKLMGGPQVIQKINCEDST
ncbi:unnamed protein product, partial [Mesorhabditis belari]|uniref:PRELI/MSF1 domain-containing protein n=1 Tax=Mesorhabditis belari TaxID=2138241 RepID=A0AAF3J4E2_9BILA